jgi:hypothetical protein
MGVGLSKGLGIVLLIFVVAAECGVESCQIFWIESRLWY